MRGIVNILIVILITYTLNAVPINNTMLSFDLIKPWDNLQTEPVNNEEPVAVDFPIIKLLPTTEEQLNNPSTVSVAFTSSMDLSKEETTYLLDKYTVQVFDYYQTSDLPLSLFRDNSDVLKVVENSEEGTWLYTMTLDVSAETMNAFIGDYQVTVSCKDDLWAIDEQVTFGLTYTPDFQYTAAIPSVDTSQVYTQVYYLNASKEFLVPVTKKLASSSKFIRNTINTLSYEIPADAQIFAQDVTFPRLPRVYLNNGVLSCYLDGAELLKFKEGSSENKLLTEALVKTLTDIGYVDNMTFYANDRQNGNFINGQPLKTIYNEDFKTYAYLNYYDGHGYSYLVPQVVSDGEDTIEDLIHLLKTSQEHIDNGGLIASTIPKNVELINKSQTGTQVTLTFNDALFTAYSDSSDIQGLMMDSIVQSITSLPSVNEVIIITENHKSGKIGPVSLGEALTSNRFLNPTR